MRSCRVTLTWLVVLAAVVLSVPAVASATSAGDNQYTDPLAGNHTGSGGSHTTSTPPTPTPTPTPPAGGSSGTPTTSLSPSSPTASAASSSSSPTTTTTTATASSASTLPRTGFDAGLAGAIGAGMIGLGLMTRRRIRCSDR